MCVDLFFKGVKYDLSSFKYYFFRDPERVIINDDNYLVSPADGEVIKVEEVDGPKELGLENKRFKKIFNIDLDDSYYISALDSNVEMKEIKSSQYVLIKNHEEYEIKDL